ncbi:PAPA-1-like conserved region family protein [Diplocarpon rosae]|nr:PAPA-1-like conserved region family protein [Diplocarpon rosae]
MSGRPERPSKKLRTLSTDSEGTEEAYDWVGLRGSAGKASSQTKSDQRTAAVKAQEAIQQADLPSPRTKRPRRSAGTVLENTPSTASVSRGAAGTMAPVMRLSVKTSSSKLREATRSSSSGNGGTSRDPFVGGEIIEGKRARHVKKSYVLESDSEDEEDEEMEDAADEDAEVDEDEDEDMDAEDDGMGDEDATGDLDMEDAPPPPPVVKVSKASGKAKQVIVVKPPPAKAKVIPVEQKEMEDASDDEELSELDSELEDAIEDEEGMQTGNEEDAEGDEEEIEVEGGENDSLNSDAETPANGSRASTPDLNKLTKRQRARFEDSDGGHLLALPDEVQVKKHLTAEEHAMRRAEMARRRKNLSEKRNEEEKMETINKLLKKQAPKTNARRSIMNAVDSGTGNADVEGLQPNPGFVRWVSNKDGNRIGVPKEWLDAPVGEVFKGGGKGLGGKLITEVS